MKKLIRKLINFFFPSKYSLVYRTLDGRTEMYTITEPKHKNEFGNMRQGLAVAGFLALIVITKTGFVLFVMTELFH